jgi:hypothetical protein
MNKIITRSVITHIILALALDVALIGMSLIVSDITLFTISTSIAYVLIASAIIIKITNK